MPGSTPPSADSRYAGIRVVDAVAFVAAAGAAVAAGRRGGSRGVALHPTCSSTELGMNDALLTVGEGRRRRGDRARLLGLLRLRGRPRDAAPRAHGVGRRSVQSAEIADAGPFDAYASCNRTCELGMTRATGQQYQHVLELLAAATT